MSYTGFKYDIFISYAHVDNETAVSDAVGWVKQFYNHLAVRLSQRIGRMGLVEIWWDENLDGSQVFDEVIQNRISQSAIFLALTSRGYLKSDYCQQELQWFHNKAQNDRFGLHIGERMRIFNVLLYNVSREKWPGDFGRTSGFPFNDATDKKDLGDPLDPKGKEFQDQLKDLVSALSEALESFIEKPSDLPSPDITAPSQPQEETCDVYLAEVADSLRLSRKRMISELTRQGITVGKKIPPPYEPQDHERVVKVAMRKARLSVHLLDGLGGADIENEEQTTYPRKQAQLGLEHTQSQLIWIPRNLELATVEDDQQKIFLDELENGRREDAGYDFVRGTPNGISQEIIEKLGKLESHAKSLEVPLAALLDTHIKDQSFVMEMSRFLIDKKILPYINPWEDDPRRDINILKERLKKVGALIIVYGQVNEERVRARLEEAIKIVLDEHCPVKTFGVCLAPPDEEKTPVYFEYPFLNLHVLDNRKGFNPDSLGPLISTLGAGGVS
jgi:hypothetical protein